MASVIRCAMEFHYPLAAANSCVMTCHVLDARATPTSAADVDLVIDTLKNWWDTGVGGENPLKTYAVTTCRLVSITAQRILPAPAQTARQKTYAIVGLDSAPGLPPSVAVVLSLRTGIAGRSYRGRMYMTGLPETTASPGGTLLSANQQAIADSAKGLIAGMPAGVDPDVKLGVWSRVLQVGNDVTSIRVGSTLDVQRRRKIPVETYVTGT